MTRQGVAIVGCGNVAEWFHVPALLNLSETFAIRAVVDPIEARREKVRIAAGLPRGRSFATVEEAVALADVDIVDIATPPRFRRSVVELAAAAGKHVIAEKPLALTLSDIVAMQEACVEAGVTFATVHNHLHIPEIASAVDIVDRGVIGDVQVVVFNRLGLVDIPGAAEFDPDWRHRPEAGGGVLMDFLHFMYITERLLGRSADTVTSFMLRDAHVEHTAVCLLQTASAAATLNVGWGLGDNSLHVRGSAGWLTASESVVTLRTADDLTVTEVPQTDPNFVKTFEAVFSDFAAAALSGGRPEATFDDGGRALEAVLAAYLSAAEGRSVALPLKAGDPAWSSGLAAIRG